MIAPERQRPERHLIHFQEADYLLEPYRKTYDMVIEQAEGFLKQLRIDESTPVGFASLFAISQAIIMRDILRHPDKRIPLQVIIGKPDDNPHFVIDMIGAELIKKILEKPNLSVPGNVFVEELGWIKRSIDPNTTSAILDPVDGTGAIGTYDKRFGNKKYQTTGIVVLDPAGHCLAGCIASLVDQRVLITTPEGIQYVDIDEAHGSVKNRSYGRIDNPPGIPLSFATHDRRIRKFPKTKLFQTGKQKMDCIGGITILDMVDGRLDVIYDPKGQPLYEELIWLIIAEMLGFPVTQLNGSPIPKNILLQALLYHNKYRLPFAIYRNEDIQNEAHPLCQPEK